MKTTKYKTVDEYFSTLPKNTKNILNELRRTIKQAAPKAEEVISYNMPALKLKGMLVYYAAAKNHIGFYPTPGAIKFFNKDLAGFETSTGTIKFPMEKPLPVTLIKKIVKYRVVENSTNAILKKEKR